MRPINNSKNKLNSKIILIFNPNPNAHLVHIYSYTSFNFFPFSLPLYLSTILNFTITLMQSCDIFHTQHAIFFVTFDTCVSTMWFDYHKEYMC